MTADVPPATRHHRAGWRDPRILVGLVTRYVSVASIVAAFSYSVLCVISGQPWAITAYTFVAALFVLWRHRENVARLRAGTENRLNLPRARRSRTE